MAPRSKPRGDGAGRDTKPRPSTPVPPVDVEPRPRNSPGPPPDDARGAPPVEGSEDFGGRKDIETADEPIEEHDRRHHGPRRGRSDVESGQPV
jgi:hypothetical protein